MNIKNKKYINEGFNSKAYIVNEDYILLEGINDNSYSNYRKYAKNISLLRNIKSVQIPTNIQIIKPNKDYPFGALKYKMIKGKTFRKEDIKLVNLDDIARTLGDFLNELYDIKVPFDKTYSIISEIDITGLSVTKLKDYLDSDTYKKVLDWYNAYKKYLINFDDYHFIHGDLWYENYILNDDNKLIGIVDFEGSGMGDPAYDIASLYYLGNDFIDKVLYHYKHTDQDLIKRIDILVKAREIADFDDTVRNYPKKVDEQIEKIKNVLKN